MLSTSQRKFLIPMIAIAGISFVAAGTTMAAAVSTGFGFSIIAPERTPQGTLTVGLFRTHWCGNGRVERREACDDGNRMNGDGCSSRCRLEGTICDNKKPGESFMGPDGCNTCTCTAGGMACTKKACVSSSSSRRSLSSSRSSFSSSSSISTGQRCLSSEQCPVDQYCTTEDGDCQSACEPGAQVCIQACAGVCRSNQCKPYVCADGTRHPSCSEDGHVINYFADPCLGRGSSVSSSTSRSSSSRSPISRSSSTSRTGSATCDSLMAEFNATVQSNQTCTTDADCMLFNASCPYVTCGAPINVRAESRVQTAADAYTACREQSGEATLCAGCVLQRVQCLNSRCMIR